MNSELIFRIFAGCALVLFGFSLIHWREAIMDWSMKAQSHMWDTEFYRKLTKVGYLLGGILFIAAGCFVVFKHIFLLIYRV